MVPRPPPGPGVSPRPRPSSRRAAVRIVVILMLLFLRVVGEAAAQPAGSRDSARVAALEQRLEDAVVARRLAVLDSVYAPGFRFHHSTGESQSRAEWLASVARARFASRQV